MQVAGPKAYCFEGFTLDLRRGCLRTGDREIDLRPKSFETLRYLVENAGRLVSKDELVRAVWPDVIVTDESLTRCVSEVRLALGDGDQRLIRTVPRRGYLFAAAVSLRATGAGSPPPAPEAISDEGAQAALSGIELSQTVPGSTWRRGPGRIWPVVGGLAAALIIAAVLWAVFRPGHVPEGAGSPARLSIVVLPFANLSGDPKQDYLADAITDELTTSLSRVRGSFVIARSTAFTYKGKAVDAKEIGQDLGVRYVLEGSEEQVGNRVRVNAQLISAETNAHLWADQFDTDRADLLTMQDEIVTRLARALENKMSAVEVVRVERMRPGNQDAADLALRCQTDADNSTTGSAEHEAAYGLCERALQIDGRNVLALSIIAFKHAVRAANGMSADRQADIRQAEDLIARALALEPDNYRAHHAKSVVLIAQKRDDEAIVEAERSLTLNPSYIPAYNALCVANNFMGRPERTIEIADRAIRLSPRDPRLYLFYYSKGNAYTMLKEDAQAIEWYRRAVAMAPQFANAQWQLAAALALDGREPEARAMLQRYLSLKATRLKTIRQFRVHLQTFSDNPAFLTEADRLVDGLRKAGMAEK